MVPPPPTRSEPAPWNHNINYYPIVLDAVPDGAQHALEVGCGDGLLARRLRRIVPHVTAIDSDETILGVARGYGSEQGIDYQHADFLKLTCEPNSFDFISCVAALHHMDEAEGLERMRQLLRPGGRLVVVGLARSRYPGDLPWDMAGAVVHRLHRLTKSFVETQAPKIRPPPHTFGELRRISRTVLPGRRLRRRVLWRYVLTWTKSTQWRSPT